VRSPETGSGWCWAGRCTARVSRACRAAGRVPSRARPRLTGTSPRNAEPAGRDRRRLRSGVHRPSIPALVALLHSGWRGTAARILDAAIAALAAPASRPEELRVHLGPSICGRCYEVSADVREQLTGMPANRPGHVDLRLLLAEHAREAGVRELTVSEFCTRNATTTSFFSHRAGDTGRQVAVIIARNRAVTRFDVTDNSQLTAWRPSSRRPDAPMPRYRLL
jgi:hypothetical protein